jgi:hypothetical protein
MNRMKKLTADAVGISELLCSELWSNPPTWSPESWTQVCQWLRDAGVNALNKAAIGTEPCELPAAEPAPERTQPQDLQPYLDRLIEESQKAEMKLRSIVADKLWERKEAADLVKLIVMFSDSIKNMQQALANARAVAVPEPAAQQEKTK